MSTKTRLTPRHLLVFWSLAMSLSVAAASRLFAQQPVPAQVQDNGFVLRTVSDLVLTNVVVRDNKTGAPVTGLERSDFTILEDGKPQQISSFDFENVERAQPLNEKTVQGLAGSLATASAAGQATRSEDLRDHRLIVFFFDLTSMQPEDLDRSVAAAKDFLNNKLQPADLIALVSLDTSLKVDQDFTSDRNLLIGKVGAYNGTEGSSFAPGAGATSNQVEDASGYTPDENEYNDVNTDRELYALRAISRSLEKINQKKSLIYFSGGISRDGIENQASLRAAINAAVRANLAIYSLDTRGLEAISPLGDASTASVRGTGAFNGGAIQNNLNANFDSQETLTTLSADTGGKAFLDSNDFAPAFAQVQRDSSAYYVIGFRPSNPAQDGKFRKLVIRVNRPGVKLEYRPGYFAPADFKHQGKQDRERDLQEQLSSDLPLTDLSLYLDAFYFRLEDGRFNVPVSLIVPGTQIPFANSAHTDQDKATLDVLGVVIDEVKRPIGNVRETIKLNVDSAQAQQRNIQYTTSFNLPAGRYKLKFVVRENQTGHMGSFETDITLPDLRKAPLKMSSILLSSTQVPHASSKPGGKGKGAAAQGPLVHGGFEYVPNINHIFRQGQHLYVLYEVYNPARSKTITDTAQAPAADGAAPAAKAPKNLINVISSLELIQGSTRVFQTPLLQANATNIPGRDAVAVELDLPLGQLKPGQYIAQLNIIDDAAGSFQFPRFALLIKADPADPAAAAGSALAPPEPQKIRPQTAMPPN